jgi:hypothetical protein
MVRENSELSGQHAPGEPLGERMAAPRVAVSGRAAAYGYLGLALLILASLVLDLHAGDELRYVDESDYEQVARSILHRHAFADADGHLTMARPPGYPAVIALAYTAAERPLAAKIANALFLALATLALGVLARRIEPRASILVPYLVIAYPLLLYASSLLYPQTLGCLLLTVTVLLVTGEHFKAREAVVAGIIYGVLILAIPYFLVLVPLFAAFIVFGRVGPKRPALLLAILMVGVSALMVVPWTVRNYVEFHAVVPVSANNGNNLFIGNSPATTPNSGRTADVLPLCKPLRPGLSEYEFDVIMRRCAVDWITQNPGAAARLYVGKVINYFNYRNEIATPGESARWRDWVSFFTYYPLLLLALARLVLMRRFPMSRTEIFVYALYFLNAFASAIFFTRMRFRIPFDFVLIGINAAFLVRCWRTQPSSQAVPSAAA